MTTAGWIVMVVSVTSVTVFFSFSLYLALRKDR